MEKVRPAFLLQFGIVFVVYCLQPLVAGLFAGHFHGNVAKPAVRLGTVPVLHLRRNDNDRSRGEAYCIFPFFLIPAFARGAAEDLPAAGFRVMDVPVVAAARFKGDVCQTNGAFAGLGQGAVSYTHLVLTAIGQKYGKSAAQVALRWNVQRGVTVIPKSVHKERMEQNLAIWDFALSDEDMKEIAKLEACRSNKLVGKPPTAF